MAGTTQFNKDILQSHTHNINYSEPWFEGVFDNLFNMSANIVRCRVLHCRVNSSSR